MRILFSGILSLVLVAAHVLALGKMTEESKALPKREETIYVLPASLLKIVSLEYKELVSDYLFLQGMVFIGSTQSRKERPRVSEKEWEWLYTIFDASTTLDPYFADPYYAGNAILTWDGGKINEANALLEKGTHYRDWDWSLPFFIGFNHFYFLQDYDKAAEFLMVASRMPGASPTLASLASKMAFKAKRTENSIVFLEAMIKKTDDESMKKMFETRVEAFKAIFVLENAVDDYRKKFRRFPVNLDELIKKKIISEIPKDPYGGKFSIDSQGAIRTTSESLLLPHQR